MSACMVFEIRALASELPYTVFYKDKVQLQLHPAFLSKVVSQFRTGQDVYLPIFFPKPHKLEEERKLQTLDIRRALAFYIERTKPFCKSQQFVMMVDRMKGLPGSAQRISS